MKSYRLIPVSGNVVEQIWGGPSTADYRRIFCAYCGEVLFEYREYADLNPAAHERLQAIFAKHDADCQKNPLVARIAQLKDAVARANKRSQFNKDNHLAAEKHIDELMAQLLAEQAHVKELQGIIRQIKHGLDG